MKKLFTVFVLIFSFVMINAQIENGFYNKTIVKRSYDSTDISAYTTLSINIEEKIVDITSYLYDTYELLIMMEFKIVDIEKIDDLTIYFLTAENDTDITFSLIHKPRSNHQILICLIKDSDIEAIYYMDSMTFNEINNLFQELRKKR